MAVRDPRVWDKGATEGVVRHSALRPHRGQVLPCFMLADVRHIGITGPSVSVPAPTGESLRSLADFNKTASQRMIAIVTSLRSFARLDRAVEDQVDMHEGLETTLALIENQLKDRVAVHKDYAATPRVRCYPSQLNQVYMNLLLNASQAIEGKGDIYLKTFATDDAVAVEITDTGSGISAENRSRLFDPEFTTKGVKVGAGLGLSIVQRIIGDHDGRIELESRVGRGTTVRIFLPLS